MRLRSIQILITILLSFFTVGCTAEGDIADSDKNNQYNDFSYVAAEFAEIDGIGRFMNKSFQGFAAFGNTAFCFYDTGYCQTIDLKDKKIISSFKLPEGVANSSNHCGVACFSSDFLSPDAPYPLLYLSSYKEMKCYVLSLTETSAELVQVIQMRDENNQIIPVYAFMPDKDKLVLKMKTPKKENNSFHYHWQVANKPEITKGENIILVDKDIINSFYVESTDKYNAGFAHNNIIYQLAGYGGYGSKKLYMIDYVKGKVLDEIIWKEPLLYQPEQEQCTPYGDDGILINYNGVNYISYIKFLNWRF